MLDETNLITSITRYFHFEVVASVLDVDTLEQELTRLDKPKMRCHRHLIRAPYDTKPEGAYSDPEVVEAEQ